MLALAGLVVAVLAVALAARSCGSGSDDPTAPSPAPAQAVSLDPAELAGQRLIAGWDGVEPPRGLRRLIADGRLAGLILFEDNIPTRGLARRSIRSLQRIERPEGLREPLLVMVDQEGGQVKRLGGPPQTSAEEMGSRGAAFAREQGLATALSLRSVGFNVDLAPVLDLDRPGRAIDREQRSFGADPETVIATGVAGFAAGLSDGEVIATAKHFPGIGSVETNTDEAAQEVGLTAAELEAGPARPFEAFVAAGGRMVMTGLATYPAVANRPAAFSARFVSDDLRGRLGFDGVAITDGLGAAAAAEFGGRRKVALAAVAAGNDLLLYSDWRDARSVGGLLSRRLGAGSLDRAAFELSAGRVLALRSSIGEGSG